MRRAVLLGGTGALGWATSRRLVADGWTVVVTGRNPDHVPTGLADLGARFVRSDRHDTEDLGDALGPGADLLVDCACFTAVHAARLVPLLDDVVSTVMISSKAVYVDGAGRHANSGEPPDFGGSIREDQPTLRPSDDDYRSANGYGANKVAAEEVLLGSGHQVTVLRPSKVHGAWSRRPREWVFVKRALDGRRTLLLANRGEGADHPSAALNVAALIGVVADRPGRRILNVADPDCPSGRVIAATVAAHLGHAWEEVLVDPCESTALGVHPWDSVPPVVLDCDAAAQLGYEPVGDYGATVADELDWLVACANDDAMRRHLPSDDDPYFARMTNYAIEDDYLRAGVPD